MFSVFYYLGSMFYYDVHTHNKEASDDTISIYNLTQDEILSGTDFAGRNIYYSAGIHPWHAADTAVDIESLNTCLSNNRIVALGEIGLDKLCQVPMSLQNDIFEQQIRLSLDLNLPVIIHCVKAWDELIAIYKKYKSHQLWIIHGFRGGKEQAVQLMKWGFMFSLGKYYNEDTLRVIYPYHLVLETDDEESNIKNRYQKIGEIMKQDLDSVKKQISQNVSKITNSRF